MTKINPSSLTSDPSLDKKHDYPLKSDITGSKDTKRVLSLDNILTPPKTIQEEWHEPRLSARQKEEEKERRDQMKEYFSRNQHGISIILHTTLTKYMTINGRRSNRDH